MRRPFARWSKLGRSKRLCSVADGARFHVEIDTPGSTIVAATTKGAPKTWGTLDATAKRVRGAGADRYEPLAARATRVGIVVQQ